ncbi:MAG: CheR family methyltransferase [Gloeotrichia echinulata IR180]|jgi:chemotaxis protein methyltransferase WspC
MIQAKIESLLQEKIGVSASIIGSKEIARVVEKRRLACKLPDLRTYLQQLQTSIQELEELIELVIVPETWFFRDGEPFNFLENYIKSEWLSSKSKSRLRLLSIPCSSGEEPYSIAMTLLNAGLSPNQFVIDAVDISKKSLIKAREAVYRQNSFRGNNLEFRARYFTQIGDKYELCDLVKNTVNFIHGNLVSPYFMFDKMPYDVIFCRNVLIYFDQAAREQSMVNLERLLTNQGLLFVGHAETGQTSRSYLKSVDHAFAFAYRKIDNNKSKSQDIDNSLKKNHQVAPVKKVGLQLETRQETEKPQKIPPKSIKNDKTEPENLLSAIDLGSIRKLADRGQLSEAATLCETYLKLNYTNVEAYVLLGQIYQAQGREKQAEQCFQKAIYLEPNDYDALMHLTLLIENRGDIARAAVLRQRIQRLQNLLDK